MFVIYYLYYTEMTESGENCMEGMDIDAAASEKQEKYRRSDSDARIEVIVQNEDAAGLNNGAFVGCERTETVIGIPDDELDDDQSPVDNGGGCLKEEKESEEQRLTGVSVAGNGGIIGMFRDEDVCR